MSSARNVSSLVIRSRGSLIEGLARLVDEPRPASLAYRLDRLGHELRVVVINIGGGGTARRDGNFPFDKPLLSC